MMFIYKCLVLTNFRLPLSTFLVNVLRHYRINLSQLFVITVAKFSHFEILCRVHDSLKRWNAHFFWVDSFNYPASFPWHTDKNISRESFPKSTEFSADDYVVLVAHPAPFRKVPEPFLYLIRMSRNYTMDEDTYLTFLSDDGTGVDVFAFIQVTDPTKVKVGEQERTEGKARLLDSTIGRVVSLLLIAQARVESELKAGVRIIVDENAVAERPKRPRKKTQDVTDASGSSHPSKKLKGDHGASSETAIGGKSPSTLRELLASSMLNVKVGVAAVATLLVVTSSVSTTPEHESGVLVDSVTGFNIRTIGASKRFVISLDYSYHSSTNTSGAEETVKADTASPPYSARQDLSMDSRELDAKTMHQVFVPQWNVLNYSLLDDYDVFREFVDHLAPPALFSQIREMDYHHLFVEFNVRTACQACLNAKVRMRTEYCLGERKRLDSECKKQADLLNARDEEIENFKAQLLLKETKAVEASRLCAQVFAAEDMEKMRAAEIDSLKQRNVWKDYLMKVVVRTGDSSAGGQEAETEIAIGIRIIVDENAVAERPKRPRKKRQDVTDASGSSHPSKKLKGDHGASSETAIGGKSPSTLRELLASSMLNVKVGVAAVATLLVVTSSVSTTPEHESGVLVDSVTGLNIRTIGASKRFVISLDYSYHSSTNTSGAEETVKADTASPPYSARQDLSMDSRELDAKTMHQVFVPQWNVLNYSLLDDYDVFQEFVDHLAPPALFSQIREMDYHHLFAKFNIGTACQACLNAKVRMRTEYCLGERKRLDSECKKQADLLKARDEEIENFKAQLLLKETKAAEASRLCAQVFAAEDIEKMRAAEIDSLKQRNVALENKKDSLDGKKDGLVDQVHALDTTCSDLCDQILSFKQLKEQIEEFHDA
nr:hypothetical protein [Tanacetum cinerariifolium]